MNLISKWTFPGLSALSLLATVTETKALIYVIKILSCVHIVSFCNPEY